MPLLLVLNELSYKEAQVHRDTLSTSIHELVQLIRRIRQHRDDSVLATEAGLFDLELAAGFTMKVWAADGRNRTAMQYLKSLRQRAPFQGIAPPDLDGVAEYRYRGHPAAGLGLAHLVGGLGVSLNLGEEWRTASIMLDRTALEEDADEQLVLIESRVDVRHTATEDHVAEHERWLCDEGIAHVRTGAGLWQVCGEVFPNLAFLPVPEWLSHVTPESQSRRHLCQFVDFDRTVRLFEMHARFTPGAGRMYFRVDGAKGKLVIAHIGRKL